MKTQVKISLLVFFLVAGYTAIAQQHPSKCGKWRWDVKTLTDQNGIDLLSQTPAQSSVDELGAVIPPKILHLDNKADGMTPRFPTENKLVEIMAYVTEVKIDNDDGDLQLSLKSITSDMTMIGEIPDPNCSSFEKIPQLKEQFTKAREEGRAVRNALKTTKKPVKVKITGIPFWDGYKEDHPKGYSQYDREIHPIIKIEIVTN